MTQKGDLFKGRQKKVQAAGRHGKGIKVRKGKTFKEPSKKTSAMELNTEITKFINQANEIKAATVASKEGAQLHIVKPPQVVAGNSKKK
ncbi:hypothetical protein SUGI_1160910 [Cryptomeria japonica]|uniref:uncharacterized protein LOC131073604 n=1 Tax=Cryptomeria japonica TaxID=3369 RepID=UPI002414C8B0|nr:uncharacterized protein LOC131073604 [Cryptomeria japonica]GLJ54169.1 hypothetical protein SUGI_1160910 [Cryptomeria japonica]